MSGHRVRGAVEQWAQTTGVELPQDEDARERDSRREQALRQWAASSETSLPSRGPSSPFSGGGAASSRTRPASPGPSPRFAAARPFEGSGRQGSPNRMTFDRDDWDRTKAAADRHFSPASSRPAPHEPGVRIVSQGSPLASPRDPSRPLALQSRGYHQDPSSQAPYSHEQEPQHQDPRNFAETPGIGAHGWEESSSSQHGQQELPPRLMFDEEDASDTPMGDLQRTLHRAGALLANSNAQVGGIRNAMQSLERTRLKMNRSSHPDSPGLVDEPHPTAQGPNLRSRSP